jgi:tetratricopeptide (TPR) repeat protein
VRYKWTQKEWDWTTTSLTADTQSRKDARAVLEKHEAALRLADQAARCDHCDWGWPPLTIQSIQSDLPLNEIQINREIANLLSLRCRLELSEKQFDKAIRTLQTGFSLARDIADGHMLIQDLVGMAVASVMLGRIEDWQQIPGSPNLYWALTSLPNPLINVRATIRYELNTIYRSFPPLRELRKPQNAEQVRALLDRVFDSLAPFEKDEPPAWARKVGTAALTIRYYADAKKALLAAGRSEKEVEAMPALQVVAIFLMDNYDQVRDDILKWLSVPAWQGMGPLNQLEKKLRSEPISAYNPMISLLLPAIYKVYSASVRVDRNVATLRVAEALRWHAAQNGGKPPEKWEAITAVPLPIDPLTGKGFDSFYSIKDGKASLQVPPMPGMPPQTAKHYALLPPDR